LTWEQAAAPWRNLAPQLEPSLLPSLQAISNVYEQAVRRDKDALRVNPMELWDLHYVRHLMDVGFVDTLYGRERNADAAHGPHLSDGTKG
jgi:hypothetical protein